MTDTFATCGKVIGVSFCRDSDCNDNPIIGGIIIAFEHNELTLRVEGDCCSTSWIEPYKGCDFQTLVGHSITKMVELYENIDMPPSNVQDEDKNYLCIFTLDNDDTFEFLHRNSSDESYYSGYIVTTWTKFNALGCKNTEIVIVVGLPGAGKTTHIRNCMRDRKNTSVYDEVLSNPNAAEQIRKELKKGVTSTIYITDARFVDAMAYKRWVINSNIARKTITTIAFENDMEVCLKNNVHRNDAHVKEKANDIERMSAMYNPNHTMYISATVKPVFDINYEGIRPDMTKYYSASKFESAF